MNPAITFECEVHFHRGPRGGNRVLESGPPAPLCTPGRVPRVARLMALALRFDDYLRSGAVSDYSELAALGQVTRPRISQIMNLLLLAPDLQEALLFLPRTQLRRDPIILRDLQSLALVLDWRKQRVMWKQLLARRPMAAASCK